MSTPTPEELTHFLNQLVTNPAVQTAVANNDVAGAFTAAGLPPPTDDQVAALNGTSPTWPALQAVASSFNLFDDAN